MLQRMCMCLKSVAAAVGVVDASPRKQLVPHARRWLLSRNLELRDLEAASAGREWRSRPVKPPSVRAPVGSAGSPSPAGVDSPGGEAGLLTTRTEREIAPQSRVGVPAGVGVPQLW